jgi:hypothetical protein
MVKTNDEIVDIFYEEALKGLCDGLYIGQLEWPVVSKRIDPETGKPLKTPEENFKEIFKLLKTSKALTLKLIKEIEDKG